MVVPKTRTTVVLLEDHPLVRTGVRKILDSQPDLTVVGEAGSVVEARRVVEESHPDLVLVDVRLPGESGISFIKELHSSNSSSRCVLFSAYDDKAFVQSGLAAGAAGYVLKTAPEAELLSVLRAARDGATVLGSSVHLPVPGDASASADRDVEVPSRVLTGRELDVVRFVAAGMQNKQIGVELGIGRRTVETHLRHIADKLGCRSRTEIALYAVRHGLVDDTDEELGGVQLTDGHGPARSDDVILTSRGDELDPGAAGIDSSDGVDDFDDIGGSIGSGEQVGGSVPNGPAGSGEDT